MTDARDIVAELRFEAARSAASADNGNYLCAVTIDQARAAADTIEAQAAEVERLRDLLAQELEERDVLLSIRVKEVIVGLQHSAYDSLWVARMLNGDDPGHAPEIVALASIIAPSARAEAAAKEGGGD